MTKFGKFVIGALSIAAVYVIARDYMDEDNTKSTVDPVTDEDLKEPTMPDAPVIDDTIDFEFIQPEFDTYADAEAAKVLVNKCFERNGYITTTYLTHIASIVYGDIDTFQDNYVRFHAKSSYGYNNPDSFKYIVRTSNNSWILTNDRPIKLKELNNDAYRPGEDPKFV